MKESFKEFVTRLSRLDSPAGDLCFGLLRDEYFSFQWGAKRKREYIATLPEIHGSYLEQSVEDFLIEFDEFYKA